jgi:glycosyltransferase involved in cell wall biosynthesis
MRPKILCIVDYFLPGYKAGGPIRSISNLLSHLDENFEFLIVTRDRDILDKNPYPNIISDDWNSVGNNKIFYASPKRFSFFGMLYLLKNTSYDILYLNSFFSPRASISILIMQRFGLVKKKPLILAPRGEFSVGAISIKKVKKKIFIALANVIGSHKNIIWQASSSAEANDICERGPGNNLDSKIIVAPDLLPPPNQFIFGEGHGKIILRNTGSLRAIFLSRISQMKNLDYLLRVLKGVSGFVTLSIYGPIEDMSYWNYCKSLIKLLPPNVKVTYFGEVSHELVRQTFAAHDVFIFPSRGENFGHVVYESLSTGTALIVSDQTPWADDPDGGVEVLSLDGADNWVRVIDKWTKYSNQAFANKRMSARKYAENYIQRSESLGLSRALFLSALDLNSANMDD